MTALCQILHLFAELNISIAPRKTFPACTCLEFMGILLDSNKMEAHPPVDKLTHLQAALGQWTNRNSATLQELQPLIGTLQFTCKVIAPGHPFLQRIIHLTKGIKTDSAQSSNNKCKKYVLKIYSQHINFLSTI